MTRQPDMDSFTTPDTLVETFTGPNADYYRTEFEKIGQHRSFHPTFNLAALLLGPIWFAARHLWSKFIILAAVEIVGFVLVIQGIFKDLGADGRDRAARISEALELRRGQLNDAIAAGSDSVENLRNAVSSLDTAVAESLASAQLADERSAAFLLTGLVIMALLRAVQAFSANWFLEQRFDAWRSDHSLPTGFSITGLLAAIAISVVCYGLAALHYSLATPLDWLATFPAIDGWRQGASNAIDGGIEQLTVSGAAIFDSITGFIVLLLGIMETILEVTPWPVVALGIILIAWQAAGARVAIFSAAGLAYIGLLGFWEAAMATVALLGTASCISILLGIPVGILCAKKPKVFAVVRPVLDFMQTMPAFVYLIPVIAFFGTGRPAGILATLVFGSPPVIRFTVLGLQSVPATVREAAIAFGATPRFLLFKVDLPLAAKTILAGINQTIMLSLSMVVVASLIGSKGLGEDVLEALQFAAAGQGLMAGLAILFCAMILDRIVQGRSRG